MSDTVLHPPITATASSLERVEQVIHLIATTCVDNEAYFCDLDSVAGDGDFGFSLARGFENVLEAWDDYPRTDVAIFIQKVAMTMASRIGGSSGPIWGTAFKRAAGAARGKTDLTGADVIEMLRAAIAGIQARGGASVGEKTLLDALVPFTDALDEQLTAGADGATAFGAAVAAAQQGAEATTSMVARRGRASYTGERSIGSPDPGAVAVALLVEIIHSRW